MNYKQNTNFGAGAGDRTDRSNNRPDRQDRSDYNNRSNRSDYNNLTQGPKISLDDIVSYIEKNKKFINTPQTEKLCMNEVHTKEGIEALPYNKIANIDSLPANLQTIFSSTEFIRAGALTHIPVPEDVDVSYISSLIMLMVPDFTQLKEAEKIDFVQAFIRKIHKESRDNFTKFGYDKLGWDVKNFVNNVKIFKLGKDLLKYVADFLGINIFILDYEMDSLIYVGEKTFSKYKKNVLLLKIKEDRFEPVFMRDALFINHKSFIIKKLMNSRFLVERLDCDFTNDKEEFNFVIGEEDLKKYFDHLLDKTKKPVEEKKNLINTIQIDKTSDKSTEGVNVTDQSSDDLNGFDQEDGEDHDPDNPDNPDSGHLSDDPDSNPVVYDSDSNNCESEPETQKSSKKNKKIVALSDAEDADDVDDVDDVESSKVIIKKKQVKKDSILKSKNKKSTKVDESKTVVQLKEIASEMGIKLSYTKNGKKISKTKPMLITEINDN